ncbi:MAG: hypothetical protein H7237_04880 [Alkalinema sp. FL-bin-369]|nr:hypothetical protein [Leptolyngbyaceae cyanobacterium LF-bin-369]
MTKRSTIKSRVFGRLPAIATAVASVAIALAAGASNPVQAEGDLTMPLPVDIGTCKDLCPAKGIQFKPGQRITVRVVNRTRHYISIENLAGSKPVILSGLKAIEFSKGGNSDPNPSIAVWEENKTPLRVKLSQPKPDQLVIELRFAAQKPGDQSVYLRNDGKVDVF